MPTDAHLLAASFSLLSRLFAAKENLWDQSSIHQIHKNGGHARARHFRTDRIFVHGFLPSKREPGIFFSQRETEDIVSLLITCSTLPPFDSVLPITPSRPLPRGRQSQTQSSGKVRFLGDPDWSSEM